MLILSVVVAERLRALKLPVRASEVWRGRDGGCIVRREFAQNLQRTLRENLARILGKRAAKPSCTLRCHSVSGPRRSERRCIGRAEASDRADLLNGSDSGGGDRVVAKRLLPGSNFGNTAF